MTLRKKIVVVGGSGFLGKSLKPFLESNGYEVFILGRSKSSVKNPNFILWDGKTLGDWAKILDNATAIVNLVGKSVNCIYTEENKKEIINSRTDSVRVLVQAIQTCKNPPKVWIQSGSLAIYGDAGDSVCIESTKPGDGFSTEVCKIWENEFFKSSIAMRKVLLRIGFVLGKNGGALGPLANLTRCFLGGTVGKGNQYISWLHEADLNQLILNCIEDTRYQGIYNATCPNPVTNSEFMKQLRIALKRPWSPPAPIWAVKIGARYIMRTEADLALTGRRCIPKRLSDEHDFKFNHINLNNCLKNIFG